MRGPSAYRGLATWPISSTASAGRKKMALMTTAMPLALLLLAGGSAPCYGQAQSKPVLHTNIMRPSSAPPSQLQKPRLSQTMVQPNGTPVNTGTGIVFTCDSTVNAATCTYLNTTVAGYYNDTFTNANANIYVQFGTTGLGESQYYFNFVSYSQYATAYGSIASKSAIQTAAQSALSTYDATPYGSDYVWIQPALAGALGISGEVQGGAVGSGLGPLGIQNGTTDYCTLGSAGCYNGIVTVSNGSDGVVLYYDNLGGSEPSDAYDFYAVVEHETDEILGTASCISTQGSPLADGCSGASGQSSSPSAVDLFRYSSAGHLVLDSSLSTTPGAYFSYNGGTTNGANGTGGTPKYYNTLDNGDDYADYVASSPDCGTDQAIQDATGCPGEDAGLTILNDGGSEVNILNAVGYGVPSTTCTTSNPNPNPNPASFAAVADFNGDCKSDILWRNTSTQQVYEWFMNGTTYSGSGSPGSPTSAWVIQGAGDFNGDGKSDLLWRNTTTGEVYVWLLNGGALTSSGSLGYVSSAWSVAGIGDFNGDGKADILWWNSTTRQVYVWFMNGTTMNGGGSISYVSSGWSIVGVGDFNDDGKADILWRNSTTGQIYIWLINGATLTTSGSLGSVTSDWVVQGIGDFNNDGKSDILWRNTTTGQVYIWYINGAAMSGGGSVSYVSSVWSIEGIGDYDGSGRAGILWRNTSTEQVYVWLMNGTTITSQGTPGAPAAAWVIEP
ncbi:MAG: FG-GAP-like repeat-containing protein [Acidobacteriaceae bacterium]